MYKLLFGAIVALGLFAVAQADDKREVKVPANDRDFVIQMASGNHAEVKIGELAEKRAASEKVKEFAARLVKDHTAAGEKLAEHAKDQKIAIVAGFERDKRDMYTHLSKLSGDEFDRAFMKHMVEDHEGDVQVLEAFATKATDPMIKKWIDDTLPTVREHLKLAKEINGGLSKK